MSSASTSPVAGTVAAAATADPVEAVAINAGGGVVVEVIVGGAEGPVGAPIAAVGAGASTAGVEAAEVAQDAGECSGRADHNAVSMKRIFN